MVLLMVVVGLLTQVEAAEMSWISRSALCVRYRRGCVRKCFSVLG